MAKICSISGVPRITRMYSDTGTLMILRRFMRSSAMTMPSGMEKMSVAKKMVSVATMPLCMEAMSFMNASGLLKYRMNTSQLLTPSGILGKPEE